MIKTEIENTYLPDDGKRKKSRRTADTFTRLWSGGFDFQSRRFFSSIPKPTTT